MLHNAPLASTTTKREKKYSILNGKYHITKGIGKGKTAKVYMVSDIENPQRTFALKLIRHEYLLSSKEHIHYIEREIEILKALEHESIVKLHEYGCDGHLVKPSSKVFENEVYLMTEFVHGGTLFDLV